MTAAYPDSLRDPIREALRQIGDTSAIRSARTLGGGCINHAQRLETVQVVYFLKWNADPLPGMFTSEAKGLQLLADTQTVRVPSVYAVREAADGAPAFILLEYLDGARSADQSKLGEDLAALHRSLVGHRSGQIPGSAPAYGLDEDNYIGSSVQRNAWEPDWVRFYAEYRLRPQMRLAEANGTLTPDRHKRLDRLIARLPELIGSVERQPSLIHGDLWGGNIIPGPTGLALIDPAVSYSDREAEIAYTELFGGFSARFYAAYQAAWPLPAGYAERRDLYNLYHLLNHLNLFGESYGYQVDAILRRYA